MKGKTVLTWALLGFVAVSLGRVALTHWRAPRPQDSPVVAQSGVVAGTEAAATQLAGGSDSSPSAPGGATPVAQASQAEPASGSIAAPAGELIPAPAEPAVAGQASSTMEEPAGQAAGEPAGQVVAYFFHGNVRCKTCRTIEDFTTEAITTGFVDELKEGRLELRTVNVDDPRHEHFVEDFQMTSRVVVLARLEGGRPTSYRRLERVWELAKDHDSFIEYVARETRSMLGEL